MWTGVSCPDPVARANRSFSANPNEVVRGEEGCMQPHFMDAQQTARYLNMSLTWVYRDARRCGLKAYRFGSGRNSKIQFRTADVLKWLEQQQIN